MSVARAAVAFLAALVGGAASPILTIAVGIALMPLRAVFVLVGGRFDDDDDFDPNSLRWIAAMMGLGVALGIAVSATLCGLLLADSVGSLSLAGASGGLVAGAVAAVLGRRGAPGFSALPYYAAATLVGAVVAAIVAAVS